ncbi:DUF4157 domain-containing protein [Janthinobacterium fluminis]|uniref:DUF4157 domain-containing protein n=1 Tax=Janthinobacterium fluminis TaxID=2987524 RepID=A0ABT5JW96_9BURK|nr:DUF4157 domain-containing protein [Janthinobacterium fluminis]MDC8757010.1 DUF4157 domain-containing protein [Janthinobacterium fluminis]
MGYADLHPNSGAANPAAGAMLRRSMPAEERAAAGVRDMLQSAGRPLDGATRGAMQGHFKRDLSRVRVHTDAAAADSAAALHASAYTVGPHIAFGRGRFAPDTPQGKHLIAHELAHTVQQGFAAPPAAIVASRRAGAAHEGEANRAASRIVAGRDAGAIAETTGGNAVVQKQDLDEAPQTMQVPAGPGSGSGATPTAAPALPRPFTFTVATGTARFPNVFRIPSSGGFSISASAVMSARPATRLAYWIQPITSGWHFNGDTEEYETGAGSQTKTWSGLAGDVDCSLEITTNNTNPGNALTGSGTISP